MLAREPRRSMPAVGYPRMAIGSCFVAMPGSKTYTDWKIYWAYPWRVLPRRDRPSWMLASPGHGRDLPALQYWATPNCATCAPRCAACTRRSRLLRRRWFLRAMTCCGRKFWRAQGPHIGAARSRRLDIAEFQAADKTQLRARDRIS